MWNFQAVLRIHDILVWIRIRILIRILDPNSAIFVIDLQDANKKLIFYLIFSAYYFLKVHLHLFSKIKSQKESQNSRNLGFSYYFCMMIEGSRSGSIPLTNGSGGSRRPKNMWSRWIRIRFRIRNTACRCSVAHLPGCWPFRCPRRADIRWGPPLEGPPNEQDSFRLCG